MFKRLLKGVSVQTKKEILKCVKDRGAKKLQDIAKEFGIPPNTLSTLIKNEEKIHASSPGDKRVKNRPPKFSAPEDALYKWIVQCRNANVNISGPIIVEKAKNFAAMMEIPDFQASTGWLSNFKNRYGISFKKICGESKSVDTAGCDDWKNVISILAFQF